VRVTVSLLALLTVLIALMLRFRHQGDGLTVLEFLLCGTWGFLLASSSLAPRSAPSSTASATPSSASPRSDSARNL
jgi:hypothetical protein